MKKRPYETIYILRSDLGDQETDAAISKYQTLLQELEAESITIQHRGRRRLAYEIRKHREGIYIQMNYNAPATTVEAIEKMMRLSEEVIRYLTILLDEPVSAPEAEESAA
ncbi:MAG: 30S ribosomal protein S6 [Oscillatoriales cyanobacterium SM2_2_1]|nr:30S ribosomal protein S6 [Oscillatoriales cyanobacterium SM2_2_1]